MSSSIVCLSASICSERYGLYQPRRLGTIVNGPGRGGVNQISAGQDGGVCECGIRRETARWHQRAQEDVGEKEERDSK